MPTLEERIRRLEDGTAIERLKQEYAQRLDAGLRGEVEFPAAAFLDLFTDDAVWENNVFGRFEGKASVREFFRTAATRATFALHYTVGGAIDIGASGTEATGRWYTWETLTVEGRAILLAGTYDDRFRKVAGRWLIQHIACTVAFRTPYESGWVKERFPRA